jgi:hypothetical protein
LSPIRGRAGPNGALGAAGTLAKQELIEPDGLEQHTVTVDLPDPYQS